MRGRAKRGAALVAVAAGVLLPAALPGQEPGPTAAAEVVAQAYTFDEALGVKRATLLFLPAAAHVPLGRGLSLDAFSGWGRGEVEAGGRSYVLEGPVDTRLRANWSATAGTVLTLGVDLPTGRATHDAEEAVVAGVLSTALLGFRQASWGTGSGVVTGVAAARRFGAWGLGLGAGYRAAGNFEPRSDTAVVYAPGDERRAQLAVERTLGSRGRVVFGFTYQDFAADELDGRDLFRPGTQLRADVAVLARTGRSAEWRFWASTVHREEGDVTLDLVDEGGGIVGDSILTVGAQWLLAAGITARLETAPGWTVRPSVDFRLQDRDSPGGRGWLAGGGLELAAARGAGLRAVPRARAYVGGIEGDTGTRRRVWGAEAGVVLRVGR